MIIYVLGVIGLVLSLYARYVKFRFEFSKSYKPICDINDHISCTKAFESKYGSLLKLPNSVFGVVFYILVLVFAHKPWVLFYLSLLALLGSLFLAYVSYVKQRNFCLICSTVYLVNILLFVVAVMQIY